MGFINRFLLLLYSLFIACFSLGVVAIALQIVPESILMNEYHYLMQSEQWSTIAGGVAVFLVSIHLFGCSFSGSGKTENENGEILVIHGKTGDVSISLQAIQNLVEQVAGAVHGVRSIRTRVLLTKASAKGKQPLLSIRLRLVIGREVNAPSISDNIREEIHRYMQDTVGIEDFVTDIAVEDISNTPLLKKKRVV